MSVITFCVKCPGPERYDFANAKMCEKHGNEFAERKILRMPFKDFFGYEDGSEASDSTWKTSFEKSVQLKLSKTFFEDNYKPYVPMKTFQDFKKRFEAEVPPEVRKKMGSDLDESKEILIRLEQKSYDMQESFDYLWDKLMDRVCELMSELSLKDPLDVVVHDIGDKEGADKRSASEDESFVCKGSVVRKRVIPDSDEDEPSKPTEAELQEQKEKRAKKRAAREAAEAAEAEQDAISDAQDQKHRDEVNAKQQKVASEIAKSDEAIAKTLAMEASEEIDRFLDDCIQMSFNDLDEIDYVKLLSEADANVERQTTMFEWIRMCESRYQRVGKFEDFLRRIFSIPDVVEDQDVVQTLFAHVVSSNNFDASRWQNMLRVNYDIPPCVEEKNLMNAVRIRIDFMYARKSEVHKWIINVQ